MNIVKSTLSALAAVGCAVLSTSSIASSVSITYEVTDKREGEVSFILHAENISTQAISDVTLSPTDEPLDQLYFGDLSPGQTGSQPFSVQWAEGQEPPVLVWQASYIDHSGTAMSERTD
ncbi:hypothetical protein [Echinimonas agarilytica]|uniref:DUF11 domain-containing protein n=1 Tax=Echinimonas agarilytica TaxID=1215918 RepID=A0AA41W7I0_9GAMM|nr:hypothetical protein [Echinimonas agarilytica]MCM2680176.1 hypothetical protein [Echinimonas agarilytica]